MAAEHARVRQVGNERDPGWRLASQPKLSHVSRRAGEGSGSRRRRARCRREVSRHFYGGPRRAAADENALRAPQRAPSNGATDGLAGRAGGRSEQGSTRAHTLTHRLRFFRACVTTRSLQRACVRDTVVIRLRTNVGC